MNKEERNLIELYPKRWADFMAGIQWNFPNEIPPMIMVRRAFSEHLKESAEKKATINTVGHIQYVDKRVKLNPVHGYLKL